MGAANDHPWRKYNEKSYFNAKRHDHIEEVNRVVVTKDPSGKMHVIQGGYDNEALLELDRYVEDD